MVSRYRHRRTSNPATAFPNPIEPGELVVNTANRQIVAGDANAGSLGAPLPIIAVRYFDARAKYAIDDLVQYQSNIFRARTANGPGAFNASNWSQLTFPNADADLVQVAGDTMTGPLVLAAGEPSSASAAAPKSYVDAADAALQTNISAKADKTYVDTQDAALQTNINSKADKTYVDAADALKADKTYVDAADALKADKTYVDSQNATQDTAITGKVAKGGDTMSGHLTLPSGPAAANAVRKDYVDAAVAAVTPPVAATAAEYLANSAPTKMLTPGAAWTAAAPVALTDGATITPDFAFGLDFVVTLGGNRVMANPVNPKAGQKGILYIAQDATGNRLITSWGTQYKFAGAVKPVFSTTANAVDMLSYTVKSATEIMCSFQAGMS